MPWSTKKKVYVIAGEASGDLHGSHLIENLRASASGPLEIYGVGGDKMKDAGVLDFFDLAHFHVTGLVSAIAKVPQYKQAAKTILTSIERARPDVVVLIDNPGFNLYLAKKIHAMDIPIVYYVAPQIWAWKAKRVLKIKKYCAKVLVVFQFEEKIYKENGVPVVWVGHPLKDLIEFKNEDVSVGASHAAPLQISLLPGSRRGELKMLFSLMLQSAKLIAEKKPGASFTLIKAPTLTKDFYHRLLGKNELGIRLVDRNSYDVIRKSALAIVCSGTATLECALLGTPMIITNKVSFITYVAAKIVIRVKYLGLPNLILDEPKIPELLQYDATPEKVSAQALKILNDPVLQKKMRNDLEKVSRILGEPGASKRAAEEILKFVR